MPGCAERVGHYRSGITSCSRPGIVEEEGKLWCRQHSPSACEARRRKRDEAEARRDARISLRWEREALERRCYEAVASMNPDHAAVRGLGELKQAIDAFEAKAKP